MLIIGLTGQFCSGKDTVAKMLAQYGATVIDADKAGHSILLDEAVRDKLLRRFGKDIAAGPAAIDRKQLAKKAFKDKNSHKALCAIVHPLLVKKIKSDLRNLSLKNPDAVVVINAAVLLEMGFLKDVDFLLAVKTDTKQLTARAKAKCRMSAQDARSRIRLQMPQARLVKTADFIIDNSGSLADTRNQVEKIWGKIRRQYGK